MPLIVGTDEAGYGPNLGPLVVAATVWRVPAEPAGRDLYDLLQGVVSRRPGSLDRGGAAGPLAVADSKQLYDPAGGVELLERGVLAAWLAASQSPAAEPPAAPPQASASDDRLDRLSWRSFWQSLDPRSTDELTSRAWHAGYERRLPVAADEHDLLQAAGRLREGLRSRGVELVGMAARGLFPAEFNVESERCGNKAELLSLVTLDLVRSALDAARLDGRSCDDVRVACDKHGGRNRYAALLQHVFPEVLVEVREEGREASRYRWREAGRRVDVEFRAGGESALPVALASMTAKYLRELAMAAWNDYWMREVPGVKPTAGYPLDARRFKQDVAVRQAQLGWLDDDFWRRR